MSVSMVAATTTPSTSRSLLVVSQRSRAAVRLAARGGGAGCGRRVARAREMALGLRLLRCLTVDCPVGRLRGRRLWLGKAHFAAVSDRLILLWRYDAGKESPRWSALPTGLPGQRQNRYNQLMGAER